MAHHVYQTRAFILKNTDINEANLYVDVFTRELGFVRAIATSARKEYSKMRYSLQDYTVLHIALVRGRNVWRVTGAQEDFSIYHALKDDPNKLLLFKKIKTLLTRLLHGEEKNELLFDVLEAFVAHLKEGEFSKEERTAIELLTVLRILYCLGYISKREEVEVLEYKEDFLLRMIDNKTSIVADINEALKESQL